MRARQNEKEKSGGEVEKSEQEDIKGENPTQEISAKEESEKTEVTKEAEEKQHGEATKQPKSKEEQVESSEKQAESVEKQQDVAKPVSENDSDCQKVPTLPEDLNKPNTGPGASETCHSKVSKGGEVS